MNYIYDLNGNEITEKSKYVTTKMKIKLIKNDEIKDELTIVVKGDTNCDGDTTISDSEPIRLFITKAINLDNIEILAADITISGIVDTTDMIKY